MAWRCSLPWESPNPHPVSCEDPRGPLLSHCHRHFSLRRANHMSFLLPLNSSLKPSCLLPLISSIPDLSPADAPPFLNSAGRSPLAGSLSDFCHGSVVFDSTPSFLRCVQLALPVPPTVNPSSERFCPHCLTRAWHQKGDHGS